MSTRDWLLVSPTIGLIFCAFLWALGDYVYQNLESVSADPYLAETHQPARDSHFPFIAPGTDPPPEAYDPSCKAPQGKDESDLCAQWAAVKAVNESNRLARVGLKVAYFEGVAISLSLMLTLFATFAALRAVKHAKDAVIVTRAIGEATVRAYVSLKEGRMIAGKGHGLVLVGVEVVNTGQSPAEVIEHSIYAFCHPPGVGSLISLTAGITEESKSIIGAGTSQLFVTRPSSDPDRRWSYSSALLGYNYIVYNIAYFTVFKERIVLEDVLMREPHSTGIYTVLPKSPMRDLVMAAYKKAKSEDEETQAKRVARYHKRQSEA